jgi:hypothetical protein
MASISERLRALGIGVKSPEQLAREADPVLKAQFERRQPTYDEIMQSRRLRASQATPSSTYAQASEPMTPSPPINFQSFNPMIPGVQAQMGSGLFNVPATAATTTTTGIEPTTSGATGEIPDTEPEFGYSGDAAAGPSAVSRGIDLLKERIARVEGENGIREGAAGLGETGEFPEDTFGYSGDAALGPNEVSRGIDLLQERIKRVEEQNGIREGAAGLGETGEFPEDTFGYSGEAAASQNIFSRGVDLLKERLQKEIDKYEENYMLRQQKRAMTKVQEMEQKVLEDLLAQEDARKAANEYAALDDEAGRLNAIMDMRNLLLRESGLFGQGRQGPSYTNPMQPAVPGAETYDPGLSFYGRPEYYQGQEPVGPTNYYNLPQFKFVPNPRRTDEEWIVG